MLRRRVFMTVLAGLTVASTGFALEVRYTAPTSGQIRSTDGIPAADGQYPVSFGVWTDSIGGTMIWSETQVVTVTGGQGLFNTQLNLQPYGGGISINNADRELFLETSVSGQTLSPRMRLGHAIRAVVATGVYHVDSGDGSLLMAVGDDTTSVKVTREGAGAMLESTCNLIDDRYLLGLRAYEPGGAGSSSMTVGTVDSVRRELGVDSDADGVFNGTVWEKVDNTETVVAAGADVDADGNVDAGTMCRTAVEVVAANGAGGTFLPKIPRAVLKTFFQTGDQPTQSQITDSVDELGAVQSAIRYHGTDFQGHSVSLMPESAVVRTEAGDPNGSSSSHMRVRINELETILKSMGLLGASRVQHSLSPESALVTTEVSDASGSSSSHMRTRINELEARLQALGLLARSASTQTITPESATVVFESQTLGALSSNHVSVHTDVSGSSFSAESGSKNIGLHVREATGQCDFIMTTGSSLGTPETTMVINGVTKRFGIGVSEPDYPLHHSSGARLTEAGDFINASDANLKENFRRVDGAQLLEQLERLPIRRWNYKLDADGITHIGPTAQDFQAAFHVGADDRSISTIDPSGVALAAIQELNRKLESDNRSLRRELDELRKQIEKLAATR